MARQCVGAADMSAEQTDREMTGFVHHHHAGILSFVTQHRRQVADDDARRHHADQRGVFGERVLEHLPDALTIRHKLVGTRTADDKAIGRIQHAAGQRLLDASPRLESARGEGDDPDGVFRDRCVECCTVEVGSLGFSR